MVGTTVLHYTITRALGAGAMGEVYLANDQRTQRRVALKFVGREQGGDAAARARLLREAQAAARLTHPGIVTLYAAEEDAGRIFLVQEYVEGETLAERLARGPLGAEECLRLARALSAALAHAHAHGVLHRDLKPDNVLIDASGAYKIADFGIARVEGAATLTESGAILGSLPYLAPERLRGHAGDVRSDLFSLGAILYEAMTGRRAFPGVTQPEVMYSVLNETPPPIETARGRLEPLAQLTMKLLAREPGQRPPSAEVVLGILEGLGATTPARSSRPRVPWWIPAAAAIVLVLLGGVALWRRAHPGREPTDAPSVAVLYFDNLADPSDPGRMGSITGNLLITSLAQTADVNVLSTQRILDAMRQVGHSDRGMDRNRAFEVARQAQARRIVTGTILQVMPNIIMTAEVSDVATGKVLLARKVEGLPGQTVFQVVDQLSANLLRGMVPATEPPRLIPLAQRTSTDLEAQRRYADGLEQLSSGRLNEAVRSFGAAIARDSTFAQAYYELAVAQWWRTEPDQAADDIAHAHALSARLSPTEFQALEGLTELVAYRWKHAGEVFQRLVDDSPGDKLALYGLVEASFHGRDYPRAIDAARAALAIDPSFTLAGVHLVDALARLGRWREADSIGVALLRRDPGNEVLRYSLFYTRVDVGDGARAVALIRERPFIGIVGKAVFGPVMLAVSRGDYASARRWAALANSPSGFDRGDWSVEYLRALREGRFRNAIRIARLAWADAPPFGIHGGPSVPTANGIDAAIGARDSALAVSWADSAEIRLQRWGIPGALAAAPLLRVRALCDLGLTRAAAADLAEYERQPIARTTDGVPNARWCRAELLIAAGKGRDALDQLAGADYPGPVWVETSELRYVRGRAQLSAGQADQAIASFDTLLSAPSISPDRAVRARLYRAQALDHLGRDDQALAAYRDFLALWKNADPGTPEVTEARAAVARLVRGAPRAATGVH